MTDWRWHLCVWLALVVSSLLVCCVCNLLYASGLRTSSSPRHPLLCCGLIHKLLQLGRGLPLLKESHEPLRMDILLDSRRGESKGGNEEGYIAKLKANLRAGISLRCSSAACHPLDAVYRWLRPVFPLHRSPVAQADLHSVGLGSWFSASPSRLEWSCLSRGDIQPSTFY